ncbi:hypothetical protein N7532_006611 [Penicillium argentinense]|uniref:Membrane insertase YidC/Oxa/ALB C-terminal domain-containing protein n=1 Tax=Penicillium argentinense TaxID=1131581 RepID=A0A9W9FGE4_9EURO|nr:uncharacterized protein N7532_006611 [Penicillium argentinense]KAJ5099610.1 hypothetical protein N7532_006611 [Penicillium argentinense]
MTPCISRSLNPQLRRLFTRLGRPAEKVSPTNAGDSTLRYRNPIYVRYNHKMMGAAGLKGPSAAAVFAQQRLTAVPRSYRSISTFRSQHSRITTRPGQLASGLSGNAPWRTASIAAGPAAVRFNSTSSSETPASTSEPIASDGASQATDLLSSDISSIPEHLGYLKELGLDYGIGPSSMIEWLIEHIHIWGGLPWWASIVGAGVAVRLALLKPMLDASDNAAKMHNMKPQSEPLRAEMTRAMKENNQIEMQKKRAELSQLNKEHGVSAWKSLVSMLQIPLGFGTFRVVRGMCSLPVPALLDESLLWIKDLTVHDPLYILPALSSMMMYFTFKRGGETGLSDMFNTSMGKTILIGLPTLSFAFIATMPGALQLYFCATGAFALAQAYVINNTTIRTMLGMTIPRKVTANSAAGAETRNYLAELQERVNKRQKQLREEYKNASEPAEPKEVSKIDSMMSGVSSHFKKVAGEVNDTMREKMGQGPAKNADGSPAAPPRLTDAERRKAEEYEKEQRSLDEYRRAERNHARRKAQMQALRNERDKAQASLKRHQDAAKQQQSQNRK